jgi:tungstate transport system substrate-binding protein
MRYLIAIFIAGLLMTVMNFMSGSNDNKFTIMATTTTRDSGLLPHLITELEKDTGLNINIVAFGTGKVLRSAMDGNADIIIVHDTLAELSFMNDDYGVERYPLMQNDFVIVGPADDPAKISSSKSVNEAFLKIMNSGSPFVSRGDESGTHKAEKRILENAKVKPDVLSSDQYIITGSGMGRTLTIASEKSAYVLTDNATWLSFNNKGILKILYDDDPAFKNIYSVITINPNLFGHISRKNQELAMNWLKSSKAAKTIENFQSSGRPVFKPLLIVK